MGLQSKAEEPTNHNTAFSALKSQATSISVTLISPDRNTLWF